MNKADVLFSIEAQNFLTNLNQSQAQDIIRMFENPSAILAEGKLIKEAPSGSYTVTLRNNISATVTKENQTLFVIDIYDNSEHRVNTNFEGAKLTEANFSNSNFSGSNFHKATLVKTKLKAAMLVDSDFSEADLESADLSFCFSKNANFTGASVRNANLEGAYLQNSDFTDSDLSGSFLSRADLAGVDFTNANLSKCHMNQIQNFEKIKSLRNADMREALDLTDEQKKLAKSMGAII